MPMPAKVTPSAGASGVTIQSDFTAAIQGAGAADPRVRAGVLRTLARLSVQTGIPIAQKLAPENASAGLLVVVERADHAAPQLLGDDESYHLAVTSGQARIEAPAPLGALRGLETFLQLVQLGKSGFTLPAVDIQDAPRFPWRGLSLDVARHFIPVPVMQRTIDGLAAVKLNVLHWHLSDDEGFRVESLKYPKLHELGSEGLYYTQAEIRDMIAYAREPATRRAGSRPIRSTPAARARIRCRTLSRDRPRRWIRRAKPRMSSSTACSARWRICSPTSTSISAAMK
jgi:hexosaminidase